MANQDVGKPQITPNEPEHIHSRRDPEERPVQTDAEAKEKAMDKTLADSFPTSDPPSTIPAPSGDHTLPQNSVELIQEELTGLPAGSWAALSIGERHVIGYGPTQEEAVKSARERGHTEMSLVRVNENSDDKSQILEKAS